jgi:hypothetical protein
MLEKLFTLPSLAKYAAANELPRSRADEVSNTKFISTDFDRCRASEYL